MNQYDFVRADKTCPHCRQSKDAGLLLCWPCNHKQKEYNDGDYSARVYAKIEARNSILAARGA